MNIICFLANVILDFIFELEPILKVILFFLLSGQKMDKKRKIPKTIRIRKLWKIGEIRFYKKTGQGENSNDDFEETEISRGWETYGYGDNSLGK